MYSCHVVAGKNFGDEGKGQLTAELTRLLLQAGRCPLVIRHNGGAQAGHTVEDKKNRFIFHQLGSGTWHGADTYFSESFLPDFLKIGDEINAYAKERKCSPDSVRVHVNGSCRAVTVYDVLLNSLTEEIRGEQRHGSCGMGIYETVKRNRLPEYALTAGMLAGMNVREIEAFLRRIRDGYIRKVTGQMGKETGESRWYALMLDENIPGNCAEIMYENIHRYIRMAAGIPKGHDALVFEGAQGLLLDEDCSAYYPHLTPSHTGLVNPLRMLEKINQESETELQIHYVTRTYVTRHGQGKLPCECDKAEINPQMTDRTNIPNPWQETMRYAKHESLKAFAEPVQKDLQLLHMDQCMPEVFIHITHLDETDGKILFTDGAYTPEELQQQLPEYHIVPERWTE